MTGCLNEQRQGLGWDHIKESLVIQSLLTASKREQHSLFSCDYCILSNTLGTGVKIKIAHVNTEISMSFPTRGTSLYVFWPKCKADTCEKGIIYKIIWNLV